MDTQAYGKNYYMAAGIVARIRKRYNSEARMAKAEANNDTILALIDWETPISGLDNAIKSLAGDVMGESEDLNN